MNTQNCPGEQQPDDCWNRIGVWSKDQASCPELEQVVHCRNCSRYSAAGRQVLDRPASDDYRREWTERFAEPRSTESHNAHSTLLFRLGDEWLALQSNCIDEITPLRSIHSIPHTTDTLVKGLVNIRGELRLCVSLGVVLQLEKAREDYVSDREIHERMISVTWNEQSFVFPASEVHGIHYYNDEAVQALPATVSKSKSSFTTGILKWRDRHVGLLDTELLFYALSKGLQ
jgi:chemotaxis-related protein WspD